MLNENDNSNKERRCERDKSRVLVIGLTYAHKARKGKKRDL